jgi:GntP family permease
MEIVHSAIAILGAIVLIIRFKVDPVISLLIACVYLGLATGLGAEGTVAQITGGFGEIMAEVGLLIGFGVLIGALLHAMGTFSDLVEILARRVGRRLPYAMAGTLSTIFPSIYVDVQVVLAAPMAKESAPAVDRHHGLPWLAGAMGIGIFSGYAFVVPGLAAVAIAGLMDVPLGTYLLYGLPIGLVTALVTTFLFRLLLGRGFWNATLEELFLRRRERAGDTQHPPGVVHRRGAALRDRVGVGGGDHRRRHHFPGRRIALGRPRRHRAGDRVGRHVRAPCQQQLLLDVRHPARPHHQGKPEDPHTGDVARGGRVPAVGAGGQPGRRGRLTLGSLGAGPRSGASP